MTKFIRPRSTTLFLSNSGDFLTSSGRGGDFPPPLKFFVTYLNVNEMLRYFIFDFLGTNSLLDFIGESFQVDLAECEVNKKKVDLFWRLSPPFWKIFGTSYMSMHFEVKFSAKDAHYSPYYQRINAIPARFAYRTMESDIPTNIQL